METGLKIYGAAWRSALMRRHSPRFGLAVAMLACLALPIAGAAQDAAAAGLSQPEPMNPAADTVPDPVTAAAESTGTTETGEPEPETPEGGDADMEATLPATEVTEDAVAVTAAVSAASEAAADPGDPPGNEPAPEEDTEYLTLVDPIGDYLDAIDRAESLSSAYSTELTDLYLGLGRSHMRREEFDQARQAFLRGMQILRVNMGLNSPEQTSFLFPIADIESLQGDMSAADKVMQEIYRVNSESLGHNDPGMLPVLGQMLHWYEQRHRLLPPPAKYANMVKIERLTTRTALITEKEKGLAHPETTEIYRKLGQLHYFMASHLNRFGYSPDEHLSSREWAYLNSKALPPSLRDHYNMGTQAYRKVVDSVSQNKNRSELDRADAIAQLGDWHMAFDKTQTAGDTYQQAFIVLQNIAPDGQLTEEYFGEPKPLHFMNEGGLDAATPKEDTDQDNLEVSMTVTSAGRIRDIVILDSPEYMEEEHLRRAERVLSVYRFRPRMVAGQPAKTEAFIWHFPVNRNKVSP
jgi:tetratricopeptide (TPR) repeat protein